MSLKNNIQYKYFCPAWDSFEVDMNTKNNSRRRQSVEKIEKAFVELLQTKELREISVAEICKLTGLNRSTFYANYIDIYDLADKFADKMGEDFTDFLNSNNVTESTGAQLVFRHIYENQIFYKTYFKLGYDEKFKVMTHDENRAKADFGDTDVKYHIEFFRNGFNAIVKLWLAGGCKESPEYMAEIIKKEYRGR